MAFNCVRMNCKMLLKITKTPAQSRTNLIICWAMMASKQLSQWTLMIIYNHNKLE